MEYLIVHRAGEIYKLRFDEVEPDKWVLKEGPGPFYPVVGAYSDKVLSWLEERHFEYYWERDHD